MANAVIRTGGKQFRVSEGETLRVPTLVGEPGAKISFGEVLAIGGDAPKIGTPVVKGANVQAEILEHGRGEKLIVFKFRRRKRYQRKNGHRQGYTAVKITAISG
jgi:large subunit ribosomal protein L21